MWSVLPFLLPPVFVFLAHGPGQSISIYGAFPELALIAILYYGNSRHTMTGQFAGFFAGLFLDFLSIAPIGFFSSIYALCGFISGKTKGKVYVDPLFTPIIMIGLALFLKVLFVWLYASVFGFRDAGIQTLNSVFFIQLLYSMVLSPILFAALRALDRVIPKKRRGGYQD